MNEVTQGSTLWQNAREYPQHYDWATFIQGSMVAVFETFEEAEQYVADVFDGKVERYVGEESIAIKPVRKWGEEQ